MVVYLSTHSDCNHGGFLLCWGAGGSHGSNVFTSGSAGSFWPVGTQPSKENQFSKFACRILLRICAVSALLVDSLGGGLHATAGLQIHLYRHASELPFQ